MNAIEENKKEPQGRDVVAFAVNGYDGIDKHSRMNNSLRPNRRLSLFNKVRIIGAVHGTVKRNGRDARSLKVQL